MGGRAKFRLHTLLRVRELREREARRRLGAKQAEIARLDAAAAAIRDDVSRQQEAIRAMQRSASPSAGALTSGRAWIAFQRRNLAEQLRLRSQRLEEFGDLRRQWLDARRDTQALQKLRDRQAAQERERLRRAEQSALDEVARSVLRIRAAAGDAHAAPREGVVGA